MLEWGPGFVSTLPDLISNICVTFIIFFLFLCWWLTLLNFLLFLSSFRLAWVLRPLRSFWLNWGVDLSITTSKIVVDDHFMTLFNVHFEDLLVRCTTCKQETLFTLQQHWFFKNLVIKIDFKYDCFFTFLTILSLKSSFFWSNSFLWWLMYNKITLLLLVSFTLLYILILEVIFLCKLFLTRLLRWRIGRPKKIIKLTKKSLDQKSKLKYLNVLLSVKYLLH